jgi:hypothetical protein
MEQTLGQIAILHEFVSYILEVHCSGSNAKLDNVNDRLAYHKKYN